MDKINIYDVADFFLTVIDRDAGSTITPLKLQKILYYAQGYYLAMFEKELFPEEFQAWAHGPANEGIYEKYKKYRYDNIPKPENDVKKFNTEINIFLTDIWNTFGIYDGKYLEDQTHKEEPWINARRGYKLGERCSEIISKESMKVFFKKVISENKQ